MAPRKPATSLRVQCMNKCVQLVQNTLYKETSHYYVHDEKTNQVETVTQYIRDEVKEEVQNYLCENLPTDTQSNMISTLLGLNNAASPHLVLDLLVTDKLRKLTFHLTQENRKQILTDKDCISRVSEDDISKCLKTLSCVFEEFGSKNMALEQFYIIDNTQDPDFQGDPINNMNNTNLDGGGREGDWAGIMSRLNTVAMHLSVIPKLTRVVLPFASDQILANISNIKHLTLFQNVYRSTVTENGLLALADGACKLTLTHVVLSLNTHANVPNFCISALLKNAPKLQVLELGGSKNTKSLYFQGGDAKRRTEVYKMICQAGDTNPKYTNSISRLFIFRENGINPLKFTSISQHCPKLTGLTLFGWEYVRVDRASWLTLSTHLVNLEIIGMGFSTGETVDRETSLLFDDELLGVASKLKKLKIAGWGDTQVDLYSLLSRTQNLQEIYLEDLKIKLDWNKERKLKKRHDLASLCISHCSTLDVNLIQVLCSYLPGLVNLSVSSLFLEDPSRGLPFHFHLPQHEVNQVIAHPYADLKVISEMKSLESLQLNVNYTADHQDHDFALPLLLIRGFAKLESLHLDNYINRRGGILSYTFDRLRSNNRLQWFLNQYNRDITVDLN